MTSGSPPVLSISLSDHNFSALASSFACTLAHSRPLWRLIFFSKRSFNAVRRSSRCFGDNCLLLLVMLFILLLQAHRTIILTVNGFMDLRPTSFPWLVPQVPLPSLPLDAEQLF